MHEGQPRKHVWENSGIVQEIQSICSDDIFANDIGSTKFAIISFERIEKTHLSQPTSTCVILNRKQVVDFTRKLKLRSQQNRQVNGQHTANTCQPKTFACTVSKNVSKGEVNVQ